MANEIIQNNYGDENIRTLEGVEHIRLRPGMYIGTLGNGANPSISASNPRFLPRVFYFSPGTVLSSRKTDHLFTIFWKIMYKI